MASDKKDRLFEIYRAYKSASDAQAKDLKDAKSEADVERILANVDQLQAAYFGAAKRSLDATGDDVEAAYKAAKAANDAVDKARKKAVTLAERIQLGADALAGVAKLIKSASSLGG